MPMRLHSIDFLRGLALTIVLLDHVDLKAKPAGFFRDWTLMGLGFSDAAEAFVFLSGFTFGWVYSPRIARNGFWPCQRRVLVRSFQIYASYLATVCITSSLGFILRGTALSLFPAVTVENSVMLRTAFTGAIRLAYQPLALGILCMYTIVLPFLPLLLWLYRRRWWAAIIPSFSVYVYANACYSVNSTIAWVENWFFNPLAWQFLLVLGMTCGHRARNAQRVRPHTIGLLVLALLIILYGLMIKKGTPPLPGQPGGSYAPMSLDFWRPPLVSKTPLAPLRLLHFLAIAYLVSLAAPRLESAWRYPLARIFVVCGRHSLAVYCAGTVLTYLSVVAFRWVGATPLMTLVIGLDACLLQFAFATLLDRHYPWPTEPSIAAFSARASTATLPIPGGDTAHND